MDPRRRNSSSNDQLLMLLAVRPRHCYMQRCEYIAPLVISCRPQNDPEIRLLPNSIPSIEQVPAALWQTWVEENDGVLLDVREPSEWAQGKLPDSKTISLALLPASLGQLDPGQSILVVCRAGNRSQVAALFLQRNGFESVANLSGGLTSIGLA